MIDSWKLYALGSALFAGLTAVLAKVGIKNVSSNYGTLLRTLVILFFLILVVSLRQEWINPLKIEKRSLVFLVLSGIAAGLSWLCYFRALQIGQASLVASIDKLSLVFVVLLSLIFVGERLNLLQWTGVALMTLGAFLIAKI